MTVELSFYIFVAVCLVIDASLVWWLCRESKLTAHDLRALKRAAEREVAKQGARSV